MSSNALPSPEELSSPALLLEVWLEILGLLEYDTLVTKIGVLNHAWARLLAAPPLAGRTFRAMPDEDQVAACLAHEGRGLVRHPLFSRVHWLCKSTYDDLCLTGRSSVRLADIVAQDDKATSPALTSVVVVADENYPLEQRVIVNSEGVTVRQVFEAWCEATHALVPADFNEFECIHCGRERACDFCASPDLRWHHLLARDGGEMLWALVKSEVRDGRVVLRRAMGLDDLISNILSIIPRFNPGDFDAMFGS